MTNSNSLSFIDEGNGLIQKSDPIYLDPVGNKYLGAQFYAPSKYFLGTNQIRLLQILL